jgi:hypothetical protein
MKEIDMSEPCTHPKVSVYSHLVSRATYYEPAEYEDKIVCNECGHELADVPVDAKVKEWPWEEEFEEE